MGIRLTNQDEGVHTPGDQINWNESRYIDFWDAGRRIGGWFRIGARPNAKYAEMSACDFLPDGRTAFAFDRAEIAANGLTVGGRSGSQAWEIVTLVMFASRNRALLRSTPQKTASLRSWSATRRATRTPSGNRRGMGRNY